MSKKSRIGGGVSGVTKPPLGRVRGTNSRSGISEFTTISMVYTFVYKPVTFKKKVKNFSHTLKELQRQ